MRPALVLSALVAAGIVVWWIGARDGRVRTTRAGGEPPVREAEEERPDRKPEEPALPPAADSATSTTEGPEHGTRVCVVTVRSEIGTPISGA